VTPLGDLCEFIRGVTYGGGDATYSPSEGKLPILRAGNIQGELDTKHDLVWVPSKRVSKEQLLRQRDIAICMSSGSSDIVGKTAQVRQNFDASIGAFCGIIRPKDLGTSALLAYFFRSSEFRRHRDMIARGANIQNLRFSQLENIGVPLPSKPEQQRITRLLDKADRLRRSRQYAQELSDRFLQSVFLKMFGDPMTNPCGWATVELGDLVQAFEGGVNFNPVPENSPSSPWRVLKISSVTSGEFKPGESKAIAPDTTFNELLIVRKGDLLMSRANTTELVGAVCMVRHIPPRVLLPDKLWRMKLRRAAEVNANYLLHILQLPHIRRIIGELATGTSGSMKNISKDKAGTIPIMLPPHGQQEAFAEVVHRVERLRAQQHEAERQGEHLFQTLLHRTFAVESDVV